MQTRKLKNVEDTNMWLIDVECAEGTEAPYTVLISNARSQFDAQLHAWVWVAKNCLDLDDPPTDEKTVLDRTSLPNYYALEVADE